MTPSNDILFSSDLWKPALEKYASATHVTVKLFDTGLRVVFGPIHPTPLFELFDRGGYDPGLFAECARQCLAQTRERPALTVSKVHGLAVVGTSLVLDGKIVGAAVAGYVLLDFSQLSEIQRVAKDAHLDFARLWQIAREQSPVSQQRLNVNGELLQVLGDALLRENSRTRQHEHTALELQETASALRENEERYRTLFDLGPIAVYSCDASGVIRDFNRRAIELWGREPKPGDTDERWCRSFKLLSLDGVFMPHEQCPMAQVLSGQIPEACNQEVQIERPDGSRITVMVNIRPLKNERGEIVGAINCFVEITERKQAEEMRGRLAAIVESSDDAMISKTLDGTITSWNNGAERLFGYTAEEAIGQNITLIIPPDRLPEEVTILARLRCGERIEHFDTLRMRKDGTMIDVSLTISPVRDAVGHVIGASKVARDITGRKLAEQALKDSHDNLEQTVEQRTATLRELSARLLRAQDDERRRISRELHDSVGQYLAHAKMIVAALKISDTAEKRRQGLAELTDDLNECVTETRTISYLLHPPLLDELGLTSAIHWYVEGFSKRSGIKVNLNVPEMDKRLPSALELLLFRILQESLVNVHRHSRSKSVDIQLERGRNKVTLQVRDHGQGIPSELLQQFAANGGGGGVGLKSMRGRVSEVNGQFELQSDKTGTLVRVTVPLLEAEKELSAAARNASRSA